jgi:hypothetical protein
VCFSAVIGEVDYILQPPPDPPLHSISRFKISKPMILHHFISVFSLVAPPIGCIRTRLMRGLEALQPQSCTSLLLPIEIWIGKNEISAGIASLAGRIPPALFRQTQDAASRPAFPPTQGIYTDIPEYAILSHRWGQPREEVSFEDLENHVDVSEREGHQKLKRCCTEAGGRGLRYVGIDTCCTIQTHPPATTLYEKGGHMSPKMAAEGI